MQMAFAVVASQPSRHGELHGKKRQPQDPGSNNEPGAPSALYTFPKIAAVISSLRSPCLQLTTFPSPGHPPPSGNDIRGNNSGDGSTVRPAPKLTFKPPTLKNFLVDFLPCYGAQVLGNFVGSTGKTWVTMGTVALTATKPLTGGPLLVLWTGINAYKAATACTLASRGGVPVRRKLSLSDQEFHTLYCPVKNPKGALFLVASFSVVVFVSWKGLHKALEHPSFVELLFGILVAAMLAKWLVAFTCFRERLVFGIVIVSLVSWEVQGFAPSVFSQHVAMVKFGELALSLLGLLVSLSMLVQSARSPRVRQSDAEMSIARPSQRSLPILAVVILAVLLLGSLLYFLPFQAGGTH
jgi:hypothetical protein